MVYFLHRATQLIRNQMGMQDGTKPRYSALFLTNSESMDFTIRFNVLSVVAAILVLELIRLARYDNSPKLLLRSYENDGICLSGIIKFYDVPVHSIYT